MKESDGGNVFAFVQAGALYVYNSADNRLARLHSFRDEDNDDLRARYETTAMRFCRSMKPET